MDPITAFGLLASIGQLIDLTSKLVAYVDKVKDAPKDRAVLAMEASSLVALLSTLNARAQQAAKEQDPWFVGLQSLGGQFGPIEQLNLAMNDLAAKFETKKGGALRWPFTEKSIKDILTRMERLKSHISLALQGDHFTLDQSIKSDISDVASTVLSTKAGMSTLNSNVSGITKSLQGMQATHDDQTRREIAEWLSPLNFMSHHSYVYNRRHEGTGQWLLESDSFKEWTSGSQKFLWCPGIPGAGKTVLASTVVEHLKNTLDNATTRTVCIYCNHEDRAFQTPVNLIASMLKQLIQDGHPVRDTLSTLHQRHGLRSTRPSLSEITEILRQEFGLYKQIFVVVDALDECSEQGGHRARLLEELQKITGLNLMVTSRPHLDVQDTFQDIIWLEVRASDKDLHTYIDGRLKRDKLAKHVKGHKDLQEDIRKTVIAKANGMFLLAQLHMDSLASKNTTKAVRKALETMPTSLDATYDEAVKRIKNQDEEDKDLAFRVLAWVSHASRPLNTDELRQALAVEPEENELDDENMPDQEILLSVCAGLISCHQESGTVHLVHYTAQEYFERNRTSLFPDAQRDLASTCLTYLSFGVFNSVSKTDNELSQRLEGKPMFLYAAKHWGDHARETDDNEVRLTVLGFVKQMDKLETCVQALSIPQYLYSGYSQEYPKGVTGLWLASYFGLDDIVQTLIDNGFDVDVRDSKYGWSALNVASENGHHDVVQRLLAEGADANWADLKFGRTPLYQAASNGRIEVAQLLLNHGADIETLDNERRTALHAAAASGHREMVLMLAAKNANLEARDKADWTPLHRAAAYGHHRVVEALIEKSAEIEAVMRGGWTALAKSAENGWRAVVSLLIEHGANVKSRDKDRSTPLHMAVWDGHGAVAAILIENGADIEAHDQDGWTPLHDAAWRGNLAMIVFLLDKGANIAAVSSERWTALHRATFGGQAVAAELLLQKGADPEAKDVYGETALLQASWSGHERLVQTLIAAKASINTKANDGETALHRAAANGHINITAILLVHGANMSAKNKEGETALDQAFEYKEVETVKVLTQWKASHQTTTSTDGASTPVTPKTPVPADLAAGMTGVNIDDDEEDYEIIDEQQPEEQSSDEIDPAIFEALPFDRAVTTIAPYGPPGFSMKARISTVVNGENRRYFIKTYLKGNDTSIFEGEHLSLNAINSVVPSIGPASLAHGKMTNTKGCFMVTEFLDRNPFNAPARSKLSFARKLATLHSTPAPISHCHEKPMFGFPVTTICGPTMQPNSFKSSWAAFFAENRLAAIGKACELNQEPDDELKYWISRTIEFVVPALLSDGHLGGAEGIMPVVVHGNLWQGNKMCGMIDGRTGIEDLIFDPSASYSHSEFEIGIMRLFGGFPAIFWQEYHRYLPKTEPRREYEDRVKLYSLYHQLNHHAVYGGSYREESLEAMQQLCGKYA